jgi:hypothetical protein
MFWTGTRGCLSVSGNLGATFSTVFLSEILLAKMPKEFWSYDPYKDETLPNFMKRKHPRGRKARR